MTIIAATAAFAQSRQMQKLETQVEVEYANFVDNGKTAHLPDAVALNEFLNYIQNATRQKVVSDYAASGFYVQENGTYSFSEGTIAYALNKKTGFYEDVSDVNVFTANFVAASDSAATLSLQFDGSPRQVTLTKDSVRVFPLGWLAPRYQNSNVYVAMRLVKAERLPTPCSIAEIVDDIIYKNRSKKCFEAGSPELKTSK